MVTQRWHVTQRESSGLYVLVWLFSGLAAFPIGYLEYHCVVKTLTDLGSSWLGLVVAAAYAWLGIKTPE